MRYGGKHGTRSKCVAHEDNGRLITTRRRPIGEKEEKSILRLCAFCYPLLSAMTQLYMIHPRLKANNDTYQREEGRQVRIGRRIHIVCTDKSKKN